MDFCYFYFFVIFVVFKICVILKTFQSEDRNYSPTWKPTTEHVHSKRNYWNSFRPLNQCNEGTLFYNIYSVGYLQENPK